MSQSTFNIPNLFNPHLQSEKELIDNFVVRLKEFKSIYDNIKHDNFKYPPQHYIIQGQRGTGKSTLLWRIYYAIKRNTKLKKNLIPIIFTEEQYHVRNLGRLWEKTATYLEDDYSNFVGIVNEIENVIDEKNYEEKCFKILISYLRKRKKHIVLFIDNVGVLLEKFSIKEQQRLREILITTKEIRIVGASAISIEREYDYGKPFFEFFKIIQLGGLNKDETIKLLQSLGKGFSSEQVEKIIKNEPGRIESLRRLTSGIPRTIVLLFEIFIDNEDGHAFSDLEILLDKVTPLYKHRMDELKPNQQDIVDAIAMSWDAIATKEIAKKTRMPSKIVSAQLKDLIKNRVVRKEKTSTKNHLYLLDERFFNIWYLMRNGRKADRNRVLWLVKFLEVWCNNEELLKRVNQHVTALKDGKISEPQAYYMTEALSQTSINTATQDILIRTTRKYLNSIGSSFAKELSKSDRELWDEAQNLFFNKNDYQNALNNLLQIKRKHDFVYNNIGMLFIMLNNEKKAKVYLQKVVDKNDPNILLNRGFLYEHLTSNYKQAEKYYLKAIKNHSIPAMNNLALLYETKLKDYKKAEKYYLMAIEFGELDARFNLAVFYLELNKNRKKILELAEDIYNDYKDFDSIHLYSIALLINNEFQKFIEIANGFINNESNYDEFPKYIGRFFVIAIAKQQYNYVFNLFEKNKFNIKDRFKPVYYALMHFMKNEHPDEYKKMGPELKQTVEEIVKEIEQLRITYS